MKTKILNGVNLPSELPSPFYYFLVKLLHQSIQICSSSPHKEVLEFEKGSWILAQTCSWGHPLPHILHEWREHILESPLICTVFTLLLLFLSLSVIFQQVRTKKNFFSKFVTTCFHYRSLVALASQHIFMFFFYWVGNKFFVHFYFQICAGCPTNYCALCRQGYFQAIQETLDHCTVISRTTFMVSSFKNAPSNITWTEKSYSIRS